MWTITILSNIGNNSLVLKGKTIKSIVEEHIETNPILNEWLDVTTIQNIRLGRRKHIEKWVIIEKIRNNKDDEPPVIIGGLPEGFAGHCKQ
mgnify:CR=1 FL=1